MSGRRLKTVVCGTTFGQFYLAALAARPAEFEIVGVLANGSERSVQCAARHGVPLYTAVAELPDDVDLACVVVRSGVLGGTGTELALELLRRGIHVVQEQPVHHDDLVACLREARRNGVRYRLGDLYVRLPAVRRFAAAARKVLARQPVAYVDAACASQVAFPMLHILGDALGAVRPWQVSAAAADEDAPFAVLTGRIGGAPLTLRVHNQVDPDDPDNHLHLLHRITLGTDGGALTLTDTHGPVLWSPRLYIPESVKNRFDFTAPGTGHLTESSSAPLGPAVPPDYRHVLQEQWPAAISQDLGAARAAILGAPDAERPEQYHLTLSRMWQDLTKELGYPSLRPGQRHQPLSAEELTVPVAPDDPAELIGYAAGAADRRVGPVDRRQVRDFVRQLDDAVLGSMLGALQRSGVLTDPACGQSPQEILTAARVAPQHQALIGRWLRVLADRSVIERDGTGFRGASPEDPDAVDRAWDSAASTWQQGLGSAEFIDYLRDNARRLPQLMTGEQQAALLLFPEGSSEIAAAVYRDTITARYLNTAVARAVSALADDRDDLSRPLRIVEVGAGTGATTEAVVSALAGGPERTPPIDYLFTDVSHFFVAAAKERFAGQRWIRYGCYDIDRDPAAQGLAPDCADVVIAAGVLNNARDTDATLRAISGLLAPAGWLFITEPTREHLEILASQSFMMTTADDARRTSDTTFLSRRQWLDALTSAGFERIATAPDEDHPLAPLGQRLFAARAGRIPSSGVTPC
ncbi:thiazolinyl imide reductase [Streptomyces sp. 2333.5]|uniref:bifunctional Gfo/Idh/MocA family oxidoreductase/class I SAM-dependent methyltransferase n=1 Tax=unclassified Streptomyces TaxID=2593676 RepID=UPI00089DA00A|nr:MULTISPECIES: bifunctional Gfo/Idh/MocA family oxidoreductase/class I SAM-dependent methyltransferase [unclassified Streptomyces]PJJ05984.1 thiazolinyl imide reductase [Streptomyces sp. 2333.5]SEE88140.1 thiazolinyl imide reductase [Streptomyces sp. 2314.4]SEF05729.1 thiazolinyl imide reductase [Streptomyces sp. 2112.2]